MHKRVKHVSDATRHQRLNGVVGHSVSLVILSPGGMCADGNNKGPRTLCNACGLVYAKLVRHIGFSREPALSDVCFSNSVVKKEGTRRGALTHQR